jgi:hypothetical protein
MAEDKKLVKKTDQKRSLNEAPKGYEKQRAQEEHSRSIRKQPENEPRRKEKKDDWMKEKPSKPKGGYPDHPQGMSGGSSVPRKPGPKKPASPAAKRLQRTASRSK